ncbi:MAG: class I SAM-dependent methyltransferase [Elusimicrobia bacterium]|nr:class I SAM-dependent methyltransferase [Elusimicrobiota bacterium]
MNTSVKAQFDARSAGFSRSASWVTDRKLLAVHRRAIKGLLPRGARLLEACCGTGEVTGALKRRGLETYGLDVSSGMLARAARHISRLRRGDAHKMPYPDGFFDAVVIRQAMQFLRPAAFLKEAARVLKPGGTLLLSQHVPRSAKERLRLLRIYRLIQPSGVFNDPAKLYMGRDLRAHIARSGLRLKRELSHFSTQSITTLLKCYPNLSEDQKNKIFKAYLETGAADRKACGMVLKNGDLRATWKWVLFAAQKGGRS